MAARSTCCLSALLYMAFLASRTAGSADYDKNCNYVDETVKPRTCLDLLCRENSASGVYTIYPLANDYSFQVYCDQETDGGGWTLFQRRMDGWVDFYRNWQNYKLGFGDANGEHWLGNDKLALLVNLNKNNELRIDLEAVSNEKAYARYNFSMGDKSTDYTLHVSDYSGNAGDSMATANGLKFSTFDRENDNEPDEFCAKLYHGAWWYNICHQANLNGNYRNGAHKSYADGVNWHTWKGYYESLKTTEMKFRPQL